MMNTVRITVERNAKVTAPFRLLNSARTDAVMDKTTAATAKYMNIPQFIIFYQDLE